MKALVTGGNGFIGRRIVEQLLGRGTEVRVMGRRVYPQLETLGVTCFQHDLAESAGCREAMRGCDIVFHLAGRAGAWGARSDYHRNNVVATHNCVEAAIRAGVDRFVFTSSPSVVFGGRDLCGVDESHPYPAKYEADYPYTKAVAEQFVLAQDKILTVALRPHLVFGPGDPHLFPRLIARARAGTLFQVGDGDNWVDVSYVDNVAEGHLLAADALRPGSAVAGRPYFISQNEPVRLWDFLADVLRRVGAPPITRRLSYRAARSAGTVIEAVHRLFQLTSEPRLTPFLAAQLATSHWFDQSAARRDFGYTARVSTEEAIERTVAAFRMR